MPKTTYNNLPEDRKNEIMLVCKKEFEENTIAGASVAHIVDKLGIARGSFYKYFNDIEDCYFYVLMSETREMHEIFMDTVSNKEYDFISSLEKYGELVANEIHREDKYKLYKNRFLGWTADIQIRWQKYFRENNCSIREGARFPSGESYVETMHIIKAVVHDLVERNFLNNWTKKEFISKYNEQVKILENGIAKKDRR